MNEAEFRFGSVIKPFPQTPCVSIDRQHEWHEATCVGDAQRHWQCVVCKAQHFQHGRP